MIYEQIRLSDESEATLTAYAVPCEDIKPKRAILVIPGGGYHHVSMEREGECIALAYAARGLSAFVLNYTVPPKNELMPLTEAARAMAYIRDNAERYRIDKGLVFAIGFSAGGHLLGSLSTAHGRAEALLGLPSGYARPTGSVYCYPVVTAMTDTHVGSYENLLGTGFAEIGEEKRREYSHELNVTSETPPAFIWHTATDRSVPPFGSLRLAEAYVRAGVTVEMHLYPEGPHGSALCTEHTSLGNPDFVIPRAEPWLDLSVSWIKHIS